MTESKTNTKEEEQEVEGEEEEDNTTANVNKKGEQEQEGEDEKKQTKEKNTDQKKGTDERPKKKYTNWPLRDIKEPLENDVMYGRGGGTNHHPGNKRYRKMVEERKLDYVNSKRLDKPLVALDIIRQWRAQDPPGRFLKLDEKTGLWHDVGDKKAREKTSQALREKAPEIRRKQEEEQSGKDASPKQSSSPSNKNSTTKTTRFAEGTKEQGVKHAVLARDHSLGREYLQDGEAVSLDGFTWDAEAMERMASFGSILPPSPSGASGYYPPGRITSHGSTGMAPPTYGPPSRTNSHSSVPAPHDYYSGRTVSGDQRQYSGSWSRVPSSGGAVPPPPPPPMAGYSSPYAGGPPPTPPPGAYGPREHSLGHNPLRDATVSQPASRSTFEGGRQGSGYWPRPSGSGSPPSMPPKHRSSSYGRYDSGYERSPPQGRSQHRKTASSSSSSYSVDMALAQTWSGGHPQQQEYRSQQSQDFEAAANMFSGNSRNSHSFSESRQPTSRQSSLPRPDTVKRMTSNQNENVETKRDLQASRSVKRAALNRDNSMASNRLKAQYVPDILPPSEQQEQQEPFDGPPPKQHFDEEMRMLSSSMRQSTLVEGEKPKPLAVDERTSTLDKVAMELMAKPNPLNGDERTTTIDAINSVLNETSNTIQEVTDSVVPLKASAPKIARPPAVRTEGRLTTAEYLDIVNEPIPDEEDQYGIAV